jgi:hypothetical protein
MAAFDRIVVEIEFTGREVETFARVHSNSKLTKSDAEVLDGLFDKQYRALREFHLSELFRRGRERFGEPEPEVASVIELVYDLVGLERLLGRLGDHESWEELLFPPRRPRPSAMSRIDDPR